MSNLRNMGVKYDGYAVTMRVHMLKPWDVFSIPFEISVSRVELPVVKGLGLIGN
jgi:hypothetical protein